MKVGKPNMARGRPKKPRNIQREPQIWQFSPRGRIGRPDSVSLGLDEYEALRLADFIGLSQRESAVSMGISQQTYSRQLKRARSKLTEGIVLGKIIMIERQKVKRKGKKREPETAKLPA